MQTTSSNPFSPPQADVGPLTAVGELVDASKGARFGTFVVDYIGFLLVAFVVGVVLALVLGDRAEAVMSSVPDIVFGLPILLGYYLFFEGLWARTPGKMVFGTRVVTESGDRPGFGAIVKRTLCRCIPFEPFSFFGKKGWHDSLSHTRVVRTRS